MKVIISLFILLTNISFAQGPSFKRDTSFTIHSALQKEKKKYPFITIAEYRPVNKVTLKENVIYKKIGNRPLHLDVYYRREKKKYPGVILVHGGGWKSGDKSQAAAMAKYLADKEFVAVAVEYRLSPEARYPAAVQDIKSAIQWMRANADQFGLDKNNIATLGCSAGGQLATLVGTTKENPAIEQEENIKESSEVQAIVNIDGILAFKHPESAEGQVAAEWLGGTYEEKPEIWEEASPLNHVSKNTPPILFIASQFPRFHAGRGDMIRKMDSLQIYLEVHVIPSTPHPFWLFNPWFQPTVEHTVAFLNKVFKK